jgi:hypothetical protein
MITLTEFQRLDLRVGQIVDAAPIPATDRLLRVEVDLGTERRTLVAGVARQFTPADLIGAQVIVAANVEPAIIRGVRKVGAGTQFLARSTYLGTCQNISDRLLRQAGSTQLPTTDRSCWCVPVDSAV